MMRMRTRFLPIIKFWMEVQLRQNLNGLTTKGCSNKLKMFLNLLATYLTSQSLLLIQKKINQVKFSTMHILPHLILQV